MTLSNIVFSEWKHWNVRQNINGIHSPGIYLLGEHEEQPEGAADYLDKQVILIALTYARKKGIIGRLNEFKNCAHNGVNVPCCEGPTYAERCKTRNRRLFQDLYVAVMPLQIENDAKRRNTLRDIKKIFLDEYYSVHDEYPELNKIRG